MKISRRQHITIFIAIVMTLASSLTIIKAPTVKSLDNPFFWYGFIDYQDNSNVSNTTVTLTDVDQGSNSMTTTTDAYGFYSADLSEITNSADGDYIVVNCTNNSQVGENASYIVLTEPFQWCNLTGGTRLNLTNTSFSFNDTDWENGELSYSSYNATSNTYFNLTNDGNVKINIMIYSENITWNGNKWNLTNTTAVNNYSIKHQKSGESTWTNITLVNTSFVTDLQYNSQYFSYTYWQQFGLNLSMPTSSSPAPGDSLSFNVTFWSVEA